jgi:Icc protein
MPFHLQPHTRRRFLHGALVSATALAFPRSLLAADADPHRFALLSDPHLAADPATVHSGVNMTDHFRSVTAEVLARDAKPASILLNGDCAMTTGEAADYKQVASLLKAFTDAGLPVHTTLGNHDNRDRFRDEFVRATDKVILEGRTVSIVEGERANWFILDSLDQTNKTPGKLEEPQRKWLAAVLDERKDRPALVMVHHNPLFTTPGQMGGLLDTAELFELLVPRTHVKAVFYGHVHKWEQRKEQGIHVIGLPPVGYVFAAGNPSGWVEARLKPEGMTLELRSLDPAHPAHGKVLDFAWR